MTCRCWLAVVCAATSLAGCGGSDETPAPRSERWHVDAGFVRDPESRAVILRGVNLAGAHKEKPYIGFHQSADYARLSSDWGMNSIRFLIIWAAIEPEKGVYDTSYLDLVAERMDWAHAAGLSVVLDMHQDLYGEGFQGDGAPRWTCDESHYAAYTPTQNWILNYLDPEIIECFDAFWASDELREHFAEAWRRVAERLHDHPAVVGFDPMNEPYWGSASSASFDAEVLEPFYEDVTRAIRSEAPNWIAFIEPFSGRNLGIATSLYPFTFPDVVYAPHAYDNNAESGMGFDPATSTFASKFTQLKADADALGVPLWIGEYGGTAEVPTVGAYMDVACDGAANVLAGSAYWAYDKGPGYALLDPDGNEKSILLDQVVRPAPSRVAGSPVSWSWDDATRTFSMTYEPDARVGAATEVSIPPRSYPNDYQVECGGCEFEKQPGRLIITRAPSGSPAHLEITPP